MKNKNSVKIGLGVSLPEIIFLIFLILKLTNTVQWSWIWILSPLWIALILDIVAILFSVIMLLILRKREIKNEKIGETERK
jgi:Flp pilus assembly protein TadB